MAKKVQPVKRADVENHKHCVNCGWCARQGTVHICQQPIDPDILEVMELDTHPGDSRAWIESRKAASEVLAFIADTNSGIDDNDEAGRWLRENNQAGEGLAS